MTATLWVALVALAGALLGWAVSHRRAGRALSQEIARREAVEEAMQQLASVVESSGDAIMTTTLDGRIRTWSTGAERLYGYSLQEVEGRHISLLHRPDRRESGEELLRTIGTGQRIFRMEMVNRTKDGRDIEVWLAVSPLLDRTGEIVGASTVARDITDRKLLERMKDEFVGTVSHELRTPLTAIRGFIELVADGEAGPVNEMQREFLEITARNTERLGALINDLLDT
ncbi:MAG: PAS domain S-box protein, partial [Gemmatimonadales bacterium]